MIFSSVSFSKLWIQPNIQSSFIDSSLLMPNSITLMIQMPLLRVTSKTPSPTISRALCTSYYCFTQLNYWSFQNTHTHTHSNFLSPLVIWNFSIFSQLQKITIFLSFFLVAIPIQSINLVDSSIVSSLFSSTGLRFLW